VSSNASTADPPACAHTWVAQLNQGGAHPAVLREITYVLAIVLIGNPSAFERVAPSKSRRATGQPGAVP
jgi:hypothetical protein